MQPSRTPKQLLMAEFVNCKRYPLLTYGKSIINTMKLVAYAFPTQPPYAYSSLNPDADVYVSPARTDSHSQQHDEIKGGRGAGGGGGGAGGGAGRSSSCCLLLESAWADLGQTAALGLELK
jgi:hypothetical protein